jgi:coproporphyrinogen III oxidase-like Fe-S oxidoreductase
MLKMRLSQGVDGKEFYNHFGKDFLKFYPEIEKYLKSGHIVFENGRYHFTHEGFFVSNYILTDILHFDGE